MQHVGDLGVGHQGGVGVLDGLVAEARGHGGEGLAAGRDGAEAAVVAGDEVARAGEGLEGLGPELLLGPAHELAVADHVRGDPSQAGLDDVGVDGLDVVHLAGTEDGSEGIAEHLGVALGADLDALAVLEVEDHQGGAVDDDGVGAAEALRDVLRQAELLLHEKDGLRVGVPGLEVLLIDEAAVVVEDGVEHLPGVEPLGDRFVDGLPEVFAVAGDAGLLALGYGIGELELGEELVIPDGPVGVQGGQQEGLRHRVGDGALTGVGGLLAGDLRLQPG